MSSTEITLCGSRTRYWTFGPDDGRTILMVHGFRGNHVGLLNIISGLDRCRVIVPDLPGYGVSTPMTQFPHDVAGYSAFVEAFIAELQLSQPALLGHSFGSLVAAHVAATKPGLISDLILVNPISALPSAGANWPVSKLVEFYYWLGASLPEPLAKRVIGSKTFNRMMSLTLAKTRDRKLRRAIYRHHLSDLEFPQNRNVIKESFADSLTMTVADEAEAISARVLLIAGERDSIAPAKCQLLLHERLAGSALVLIPNVGHLVHLETPAAAAQAIGDFLG